MSGPTVGTGQVFRPVGNQPFLQFPFVGGPVPNLGLTGKPTWFNDKFQKVNYEVDYQNDIRELEDQIKKDSKYPNISYRIFTTDVVIRGSKWSRDPSL